MIVELANSNADRDITSLITVLTDTPDASNPMLCQGYIALGDGTKNLDGTGGDFSLVITVGGQTIEPSPQTITFSTAVRGGVWSVQFPVPANQEVVMRVLSPNAADTDVDVIAYLYQVDAVDVRAVGGTVQTARDLGASVLLSSGTGTGQLSISSGVVASNLSQILGTALTETSGYIAAAFKKLFNVATPALVASTAVSTDPATATKQDTAQTDLDTITGTDGVTLATSQGNYAPSVAGDDMGVTTAGVTAIWAKVVDTGFSALATLKRILAVSDGAIDESSTRVLDYKDKDGSTETTHTVSATNGDRTVS